MSLTKTLTRLFSPSSWSAKMQRTTLHNTPPTSNPNNKIIILVCMLPDCGGTERYTLAQHQEFLKFGVQSILVCAGKGFLAAECARLQLPFVTCSPFRLSSSWLVFMPGVQHALKKLVSMYCNTIEVIHCGYRREVFIAKRVTRNLSIPVVLTQHTPSSLSKEVRTSVDGFVGVSKDIVNFITDQNKQDGITNMPMIALPPFFDEKRCTSFKAAQTREAFFQDTFGITLKPLPLLVKAAHLYPHIEHKNHPLLFKALHELIYTQKILVQVALAGGGQQLDAYKKMVSDLQLDEYVYFLGNTTQIPALMHYADINLLASSVEAFGIVLLEGGLMRKPTIVARGGCGAADWLIIDKQTGFLFENKNATDLANTIAYALAHPAEAQACGQRLYELVVNEFLPAHTAQAMLNFYLTLIH